MSSTMSGESMNTAGRFPAQAEQDRSAAGLQFQKYQMGLTARGAALGMGRRTVVDPNTQFSNPPISHSEFSGGGSAKATFSQPEEY